MEDSLSRYNKRQNAVRRKHARLARGYTTKLDRNGVFVHVPDNKTGGISFRILLWAALLFMGFKGLVLAGLGAETYQGHVDTLAQGTGFERVGAWLMQIDPVTAGLADLGVRVLG